MARPVNPNPPRSSTWEHVWRAETLSIESRRAVIEGRKNVQRIPPAASMVALNKVVIGRSVKTATQNLKKLGYSLRVTLADSEFLTVAKDLDNRRANVETVNEVVTRVIEVG